MLVVLDTNTLWKDFGFSSGPITTLLKDGHLVPVKVFIPQVVELELAKHFKSECTSFRSDVENAVKSGFAEEAQAKEIHRASVKDRLLKYSTRLGKFLTDLGGGVLPLPNVTHDEVVRRAVFRTRPFQDSGKGYQDTLIWLSILELAKNNLNEKIAFITYNSNDFSQPKKKDEKPSGVALHEDLVSDLETRGLKPDHVTLYPEVGSFVTRVIVPLASAKAAAPTSPPAPVGLTDLELNYLSSALEGLNIDSDRYPVIPSFIQDPEVEGVLKIRSAVVLERRKYDDAEELVKIEVDCKLVMRVHVPHHHWERAAAIWQLRLLNEGYRDYYRVAGTVRDCTLTVVVQQEKKSKQMFVLDVEKFST